MTLPKDIQLRGVLRGGVLELWDDPIRVWSGKCPTVVRAGRFPVVKTAEGWEVKNAGGLVVLDVPDGFGGAVGYIGGFTLDVTT